MKIYFSFTVLILNSTYVLPLSKNFLLQDSISAQIVWVVIAGSEQERASRSYQHGALQGPSSILGSRWHEMNFSHFYFILGEAQQQTYQSVTAPGQGFGYTYV